MLVHDDLDQVRRLIRHWAQQGCPVVVHVDAKVDSSDFETLTQNVADLPAVSFSNRTDCKWGHWSLVQATLDAATQLLDRHPDVGHVALVSGSCVPLRPVAELGEYLDRHGETDFIESVTAADVPWTIGGLRLERFTLRFPFSWKRRRRLFDAYVELQRALGVRRRLPEGIVPHLGFAVVVPHSRHSEGHIAGSKKEGVRRLLQQDMDPGRVVLPNTRSACLDVCRKPVTHIVQV